MTLWKSAACLSGAMALSAGAAIAAEAAPASGAPPSHSAEPTTAVAQLLRKGLVSNPDEEVVMLTVTYPPGG